jgi:AGCS family alanine or glycine:cation symporter
MAIFVLIGEYLSTVLFLAILAGSIFLSFKTRFVQIRAIPKMLKLLFQSFYKKAQPLAKDKSTKHTIKAHRALFTAMATTFGIGNIVAPIIAIGFGGPGALLGFVIASFFGAATAFTEVSFALSYRKKLPNGKIMGGPMQYLKEGISANLSYIYAIFGCVMLIVWSGKQTNTLAVLLKSYSIPTYLTGIIVVVLTSIVLLQGIKLIGNIAGKLIPLMFLLYSGSMLYILIVHIHNLPNAFKAIFQSAFTPHALAGAGVGLGIQKAMQWGLSEGIFTNEAGVGTLTIPHSMAETESSVHQGILSMVSVYASGLMSLLSGLAVICSGIWLSPHSDFDITMVSNLLQNHFSFIGPIILVFTVILFAFTSIIGNSYNGSQCFLYATKNKWIRFYYALIALLIFASAILDVKTIWSLGGYFIIPVALPNVIGIAILTFKKPKLLENSL